MGGPALIVHGGAGAIDDSEREQRQAAVDRGLHAGWQHIGEGALSAVVAAVRALEDEPLLNAGVGACLNADGEVELDAGVMEGAELRVGAVAAVRDVRHPVDLARAVMEDGRHVLLVGQGASRFAAERGVERCDPGVLVTERQLRRWRERRAAGAADTVGAAARDGRGRLAVAVSTGGVTGKLPGRVGDSPIVGAGLYADDAAGVACATGTGEAFVRTVLCKLAVDAIAGRGAQAAAELALEHLRRRVGATGGIIVLAPDGAPAAAWTTAHMPWAAKVG